MNMIFWPYHPTNNIYPASTGVWFDEVFVLAVILASFTEIPALKGEDPALGQGFHKWEVAAMRAFNVQ